MKPTYAEAREPLLRRLSAVKPISEADRDVLSDLTWRVEDRPARTQFVGQGDCPSECCLLLSGVVVRSRYSRNGSRQILSVHIPGDMPDLQSLHLKRMDHALETISSCRVAYASHADLRRVCQASASLATSFWREGLIDCGLHRAAIFRNAQLDADARLANFISEMHLRHQVLGLVGEIGFLFPMSQEAMGEVLGLTPVTINRAAQNLRAAGLIRLERGSVQVLDSDELARFGEFDPVFLHLREERTDESWPR